MNSRAVVFIDGGYLDSVLRLLGIKPASLDYQKLVHFISQGLSVEKVYYYHCLPYEKLNPTMAERDYYTARRKFFGWLEAIPKFEVRYGKLQFRGEDDRGRPIYVQKRVDLWLGLDMAFTAFKQQADTIILLTGDSDFMPAVEMVKKEGVSLWLCYSHVCPVHEDLKNAADKTISIQKGNLVWSSS